MFESCRAHQCRCSPIRQEATDLRPVQCQFESDQRHHTFFGSLTIYSERWASALCHLPAKKERVTPSRVGIPLSPPRKCGRVAKVTSLENWRVYRKVAPGVEFPPLPPCSRSTIPPLWLSLKLDAGTLKIINVDG